VAQGVFQEKRRPDDDGLGARRYVQRRSRHLNGKAQIRAFFMHKAGPFKPKHQWVSETPPTRSGSRQNGDKGTLYFECHYADVKTGKVVNTVAADQNVQKINGKWLITSSAASPVR